VKALVVVVSFAVVGCAVDGEEDARLWREVRDAGIVEQPMAPAPGSTLDAAGAMRLANARHEALAIEGEGYVRALLERRRRAAAFLPRLFFSPSVFFEDRVDRQTENFGLDAPLEGSLDVNPVADEAEVRRAERTAEERRSRLLALQDDVLLDAARTLLGVVLAERRVDVLRA
jgi:outer membrane protein TolC